MNGQTAYPAGYPSGYPSLHNPLQMNHNYQQPPVNNQYPSPPPVGYSQQPPMNYGQSMYGTQHMTNQQSQQAHQRQESPQQLGPPQPPPHQNLNNQQYYSNLHPQPVPAQPLQQQKLDPELLPSVVTVIEEDIKKYESGLYITTKPATMPPLTTTINGFEKLRVQDGGCARPNHLRPTVYEFPHSEESVKITNIPLGLILKPFDEEELDDIMAIPVSNSEIVRCNRCKAYMNPYMRFTDGGRRFQCCLCHHISEVGSSYFAHLDHNGERLDKIERPELNLGSYEFRTPSEFCRNSILNCRRPHIIFAFELTVNSKILIQQISQYLPEVLKNYLPFDVLNPGSPPPMIGFITYNSKIQMYDVFNNSHVNVICDISNTFAPFTSFLVDPIIHIEQIENFLRSLPSLCTDEELETETILGPVIDAALKTCQVDRSNWISNPQDPDNQIKDPTKVIPGGKVYLFHCTLPTYGQDGVTPGRLKPRWTTSQDEARKILGTDKEKNILTPEPSKYYSTLAQRCTNDYGSGVELFLFPPPNGTYLDIASLSELVKLTGSGGIYKYYNDYSNRFITDLKYSLKSSFAFDAIMKVRTSTGIRPVEYYGNFYNRTPNDLECGVINAGSSLAIELKHDDKLPEDEFVIIQTAILYTAVSGERRVRIHNIALPVCDKIGDFYKYSCCDTIMNFFLRSCVSQLRCGSKTTQQIKEFLINKCVSMLAAYRLHCTQPSTSGQLVLPESLKLLPIYTIGAIKCDAIDGGPELLIDHKAYAQIKALGSYVDLSQVTLYPRMYIIQYGEENSGSLKAVHIRCASYLLQNSPAVAYILENGCYFFLYIPTSLPNSYSQQFIRNLFGVDTIQQIQVDSDLPQLLTAESQFIRKLISDIGSQRKRAIKVHIIRQDIDKTELVFKNFLYEDNKTSYSSAGSESSRLETLNYMEFLCHLHKEIKTKLN